MRCRDDEKQQNIKRAVIKLILAEGFHGISISKIAREAGVSPATVYVYYDSKEAMLRDIYRECGEQIYSYILARIDCDKGGARLVESMVQAYYSYIAEYGEQFYFVEQFTSCPALVGKCSGLEGNFRIGCLFDELKQKRVIKDVNNHIIAAILFNPVKSIAVQYNKQGAEAGTILAELIPIIQEALLVNNRR
ncbi:MAG TPA: TetR/AcrR family transcriptional regulator [Syntrophomonadaceae bacterium]|nr:TetR/AcrR family transcriptional regulator [Syntrophomonadaceae bacterium]